MSSSTISNAMIALKTLRDVFVQDVPVAVSVVTVAELFSASSLPPEERSSIDEMLSGLLCVSLDEAIARVAGDIRAAHNLKLADSLIAATAIARGATLVTRNTRDFKKIPSFPLLAA